MITQSPNEEALRKQLLEACSAITSTDIESLVQTDKYGREGGFALLRPWIEKAIRLFEILASANFDLASETKLTAIYQTTARMQEQFGQIRGYSQGPNSMQERSGRIQNFKQVYDPVFDEIGKFMALSQPGSLDQDRIEAQRLVGELTDIRTKAQNDIERSIKSVNELAEKAGIATYAKIFREEANEHKKMAGWWLGITAALFVTTGVIGVWNYHNVVSVLAILASSAPVAMPPAVSPQSTSLIVQLTLAKLIIFSLLLSAILWAGRVYRANRHNYVVNKHRQNALSTFQVFVSAASADDQTKNAVLLQATQCIFSPQNTGFLASPDKDTEGQSHILEIWRGLPKS